MRTPQSIIVWLICCLTCASQSSAKADDGAGHNTGIGLASGLFPANQPAVVALIAIKDSKTNNAGLQGEKSDLADDMMFGVRESRSQHATRVNRNLFLIVSSILGFFVLCRIFLLWQVAQSRKRGS